MANFYTKKVFRYKDGEEPVFDYKDVKLLQRCINSYGKIESRKRLGLTPKQQRQLAVAIKRARHLGLLPFVVR